MKKLVQITNNHVYLCKITFKENRYYKRLKINIIKLIEIKKYNKTICGTKYKKRREIFDYNK